MVFTGTYEHAIDAKNRLAIPAEIRAQVHAEPGRQAGGPIVFQVTAGEGQSLYLYTEAAFQQRAEELLNSDAETDQLLTYERLWFSMARRIEMDSAGRIRIADSLLKRARLGGEVVLLGVNDHLEVRDRRTWQEYVDQILTEQPQILVNPRRVTRPGRRS